MDVRAGRNNGACPFQSRRPHGLVTSGPGGGWGRQSCSDRLKREQSWQRRNPKVEIRNPREARNQRSEQSLSNRLRQQKDGGLKTVPENLVRRSAQ